VTAANDEIQVYARASDGQIRYRSKIGTASWGPWTRVAGITASRVDDLSELDCAYDAGTNAVTLTAMAKSPAGSALSATGSNGVFDDWTTPLGTASYAYHRIAVAVDPRRTYYGSVSYSTAYFSWVSDGTSGPLPSPPDNYAVTAPVDMVYISGGTSFDLHVIQRNTNNEIVHQVYYQPSTPAFWQPVARNAVIAFNETVLPSISPSVCGRNDVIDPTVHVAMVAGGNPWYAHSGTYVVGSGSTSSFAWSQWERMSDDILASAPDCSVDSSDVVSLVARKSDGTIVRVYGTAGSWTTENLGTY
jgi:hypothetical protein